MAPTETEVERQAPRNPISVAAVVTLIVQTAELELAVACLKRLMRSEYEIDLSTRNANAFRRQLARFIEHARKTGRGPRRRPGRTVSSRERSSDIRAWAKDQGITVSDRGRIPASVAEQYDAATQGS